MNKFFKVIGVSSIILLTACTKVPAGYKGVIVNQYGSDKGVMDQPVGVGRYYLGFSKELYLFPTFLQNHTWDKSEKIVMQTSEGLTISSDVGITYQIQPENTVKVFQKYRAGIDEITNTFLRNMVRDSMNQVASTMTVEQLYGAQKVDFLLKVNELVKNQAASVGIDIDKIFLVGTLQLPESVIESINSKIGATQNAMKVENEVATARAEAQKVAIEAQAKANANKVLSESITPELIKYQAVQKWDGKLPSVTGQASSLIGINNVK
jgi:regulator of protease activity HflC (stomatin/prohibitin superfamily)